MGSADQTLGLIVREWVSGLWFAMSLCVVGVFGARLVRTMGRAWREEKFWSGWYGNVGNRGAIALFFYFLGETIYRGWIWGILTFKHAGGQAMLLEGDFVVALIAAALSIWAALCCIWVFSRSHWAWIASALVVFGFAFFEMFLF